VTGVVFEPMVAAKAELQVVEKTKEATESFARVNFHPECEAALNEQIK
jgi:ferritin heavy chain